MNDRKMIVFLLLTTTICTLLLSGANLAYVRAAAIFESRLRQDILALYGVPEAEATAEGAFEEHFEVREVGDTTYYVAKKVAPGTVVFKAEGPGLWSRVELLLAVAADGKSLYGLRVLAQAETPGLGGRISELAFQEQFKGVGLRPQLKLVKFAMADNETDAVSGATMTSTAVQAIINQGVANADRAMEWE
ncbi:MAG: FMN-binding protein [Victivallales bacterium]|nr:FMN-binding protein [Victivallales bacterium]